MLLPRTTGAPEVGQRVPQQTPGPRNLVSQAEMSSGGGGCFPTLPPLNEFVF